MNYAFAGLAGVVVLMVAGVVYQFIATRRDQSRFPAPGKRIEAGGYKMHLLDKPAARAFSGRDNLNAPTIILDGGLGLPATYSTRLQDEVSRFARVLIYDPRGSGLQRGPAAGDAARCVIECTRAAHRAGKRNDPPPYIVAGHSAGGMNMLVFAQEYANDVAGIVLIDSEHPDQFQRYGPEHAGEAQKTLWLARGLRFASYFGITRFINAVKLLDAAELAPEEQGRFQAQFSSPRFSKGIENEMVAWEQYTFPQARAVKSLGNKPLIVLTAETTSIGVPEQLVMHREYAQLSSNSVHRIVPGVNHGNIVTKGAPPVAEAIREVASAAQTGQPLNRPGQSTLNVAGSQSRCVN